MSKITGMSLSNIEVQEDVDAGVSYDTFFVDADVLEFQIEAKFNRACTEHEFFFLACEYLEKYADGVISTDLAKINEVFRT